MLRHQINRFKARNFRLFNVELCMESSIISKYKGLRSMVAYNICRLIRFAVLFMRVEINQTCSGQLFICETLKWDQLWMKICYNTEYNLSHGEGRNFITFTSRWNVFVSSAHIISGVKLFTQSQINRSIRQPITKQYNNSVKLAELR